MTLSPRVIWFVLPLFGPVICSLTHAADRTAGNNVSEVDARTEPAARTSATIPDQARATVPAVGVERNVPRPPALLPQDFAATHVVRRVVAVMGLLVAICLGVMWYGHRNSAVHRKPRSSAHGLQVVDTLSLAPRCCVHLIQVDKQRFLVARDHSGVKSVTPVNAFSTTLDDFDERVTEPTEPEPIDDVSTAALLGHEWKHRKDPWTGWNTKR